MNKTELKKMLKPLIKECIKEAIFEEGVLSGIITEVTQGLGSTQQVVTASPPAQEPVVDEALLEAERSRKAKQQETRKKMLAAIGKSTMMDSGMDLFEGTEPLREGGVPNATPSKGPLSGTAPSDAGVDISSLFNSNWKKLAQG